MQFALLADCRGGQLGWTAALAAACGAGLRGVGVGVLFFWLFGLVWGWVSLDWFGLGWLVWFGLGWFGLVGRAFQKRKVDVLKISRDLWV